MKSKTVRLGRAAVLSILLFICIVSLMGVRGGKESAWDDVHIWSGAVMLLGAAVHLWTHRDWVKIAVSHSAAKLNLRTLRLRRTNLWLFLSGSLCSFTGLAWTVSGRSLDVVERWVSLHRLTGSIMILVLGIHLIQHWNWLVKTMRSVRASQYPKTGDRFGDAKA